MFAGGRVVSLSEDGRVFLNSPPQAWPQYPSEEIQRPAGVERWVRLGTGVVQIVLQSDDGNIYQLLQSGLEMLPQPSGVEGWVDFAVGGFHALALDRDGQLWGWGRNWELQLGAGLGMGDYAAPKKVVLPAGVTAWSSFAAGYKHSAAIGSDGSLYTWGDNTFGQLGIGPLPPQPIPTRVANLGSLTGYPVIFTDGETHRLPDGTFRLVFNSDRNRRYRVAYSSDMVTWRLAASVLLGDGGEVEWLDQGPPETENLPSAEAVRYYRIAFEP